MSDRAMHFYGDAFGSFKDLILDAERDFFACRLGIFQLVLVMRKLLQHTEHQVLYSASREYSNDMCTSDTEIMVYRQSDPKYGIPAVYERAAWVTYDDASSVDLPDTTDRTCRMSDGSFESVSVQTPFGSANNGDPWDSLKLLLRNVAAVGGYTISFRQTGRGIYRIRARRYDEVLEIGTAYLTGGHYCGSVNVAIELA